MFKKILILFLIFLTSGCSCGKKTGPPYRMELEVWGVYDDSDAFKEINELYAKLSPQIAKINYRKLTSNEHQFEEELVDALASGKGPDVIFFKNTWISKHHDRIAPLPNSKEHLPVFKQNFADIAVGDFVQNNEIYAMPLHCDTLALYYNKDILNQTGLAYPPSTWQELKKQVPKLTKIDDYGNITQAAAALGRSKHPGGVNRAADILMLLMMQSGARMNSNNQTSAVEFEEGGNPGTSSLNFYTQFSQGSSEYYTWNTKMDYSIDSFIFGKTAMMINYSYVYPVLKKKNPKLNFDVAPVPQIDFNNKVNFGSYWGLATIKNKEIKLTEKTGKYTNEDRIREAWNYITFVTEKPKAEYNLEIDPAEIYLAKTKKPTARKDLIEKQASDPFLGVFAQQLLTAKSWRRPDEEAVDTIFEDMIDEVASGQKTSGEAMAAAMSRINALRKKNPRAW